MSYRNQLLVGGAVTLAGMIGLAVGALWGLRHGQFQAALEENKVARVCLRDASLELCPDLREYLKGRIYYNIASKFPNQRGYLLRRDWDFGVVARQAGGRRLYVKDPNFSCDSFDAATADLSNVERLPK